jgi:hypothetical protein
MKTYLGTTEADKAFKTHLTGMINPAILLTGNPSTHSLSLEALG